MRSASEMRSIRGRFRATPDPVSPTRRTGLGLDVRLLALLTASIVAIGAARPALAWGRMPHRAATRLAETRLTPRTRAIIRDLLEEGESMADASTWADDYSRDIPGS